MSSLLKPPAEAYERDRRNRGEAVAMMGCRREVEARGAVARAETDREAVRRATLNMVDEVDEEDEGVMQGV